MTREELKAEARRQGYFSLWFHRYDIILEAKDMGVELSDEEILKVMNSLENIDCSIGINWESIQHAINFIANLKQIEL